ncbi:MAG: patatin-like phospholipase family protein [Halanaerobium sp.]
MRKIPLIIILIILVFISPALAQETEDIQEKSQFKVTEIEFGGETYLVENHDQFKANYDQLQRPVVGLALSGGGARAMVNFGVIKALEEEGIPIEFMSGTSMGAIVATLYGSGLNTDQILEIVTTTSFGRLVDLEVGGGGSLVETRKLNLFLEKIAPNKNLENFVIPTALLSFELGEGKKYLTTAGKISDVIQSSYSIPLYFPIENRNDRYFMDAGILEATPAKAVSMLGADFVIATTSFPDQSYKDFNSATASINRFLNVLQDNYSQQIINNYADFVIDIDVNNYTFMDFNQVEKLVNLGYRSTKKKMPALKKKLKEKGIELVEYPTREKHNIDDTIFDLKHDRFIVEGRDSNIFLNYGRDQSYFEQELIVPFEDNFQSGVELKSDNLSLDIKGDEFFAEGYEARFEFKKMTRKSDFLIAYANDYDHSTKDDYRFEFKYFADDFQNTLGYGRQKGEDYYLLGTKFAGSRSLAGIQTENDFIYNNDQSETAVLSSNIINLNLGEKWDLESSVVFNNTSILKSPVIYRGHSLDENTKFQAALDFKYNYRFIDPLAVGGFFQTTDIGAYLFMDYYEDDGDNGETAGLGFSSQLYLLGLRSISVDLYFAYDFENKEDRIGLEMGYEF